MIIDPVYIDGPLAGQSHPVESLRIVHPVPDGTDLVYRISQYLFSVGTSSFSLRVAYCSEERPSALTVLGALFRPEVVSKVEPMNNRQVWGRM